MFCPPRRALFDEVRARGYIGAGFCPGGYGFVMKRVMATEGDVITFGDDGVRVSGALLPLSVPLTADGAGRPLPRLRRDHLRLGASDLLLMSDISRLSFDGRYFGPIDRSQIRGVIRPVFCW
jgi:conjugative transfer signal peptidase TraF